MQENVSKYYKSPIVFIIGFFFVHQFCTAQRELNIFQVPDSISKIRTWSVSGVSLVGTSSVLAVLYKEWYSDYTTVPFHFFNDNNEWLQMDKLGHGVASFYGGYYGYNVLRWAGVNENKSIYYGGMYGFAFLLATEIMDGLSSGWGASLGDLTANGLGTGLFITQQLYFHKQIVTPKFSYWPTKYSNYRPALLGDNHWNRWLKDYNGQVYWLSFSFSDIHICSSFFPKWISFAFGYSGDGMLGGSYNPTFDEKGEELPTFNRQRELYISVDLNFKKIKTKSAFLNSFLKGISFIKFPAPAIRIKQNSLQLIPLHF